MSKSKLHFWTLQLLFILLIVYVGSKVSFLFQPIIVFSSTLFLPIMIAGILFFIFNPIVKLIERGKVPRTVAILILYLLFISLLISLGSIVGPIVSEQIADFIRNAPRYARAIQEFANDLSTESWFTWVMTQEYVSINQIEQGFLNFVQTIPDNIAASVGQVLGVVTNITLIIITVPFILFYMLKDGHRFSDTAIKFFPTSLRSEGLVILKDLYETVSTYIQGQVIVSLVVGTGCFIGYLIIDLKYALVLGIIVAVTNIIPYVGPFIGAAPAIIVGLLDSPTKAIVAAIVVLIVQQLDGNVLSPLIIGKRLNTHPLTIILLLIGAGSFGGIIGMIIAVPTYAVLKAVVLHVVRLIRLQRKYKEDIILKE
ncbi:AI-2E family transporter [Bacillus sp. PS06]|uniref:AI-2E family transporter n=1 Tax=Bacillus sp. PS06 TaxID=2764176 RepID=UPI00177EFD35|nr:AI-2E family transporter [Bacillus sp. PS06]MBD8070832.1 AI-2E family transporter [Bacillus sp. PS06]